MTPEINWLSVIYLIGAAQGAFLVIALLDGKIGNRQANRYLAFFLLIFTLSLVDEFLYQSQYFYSSPHLIGLIWPLDYLYGPLFYFYIRALTSISPPFESKKDYWHFMLFFVGIFLALPTWILGPEQKIIMLYGLDGNMEEAVFRANIFDGLATLFAVFQIAIYIWLGFHHLKRHRQNIRQQFSAIEKIDLSWLTVLLWLLTPLWLLYVVDVFLSEALGIGDQAGVLLHVILVLIIYSMGYLGLRQPTIFKYESIPNKLTTVVPKSTPLTHDKYMKSKLSEENSRKIKDRLSTIMAKEKPYLDNEITLSQLADLVGCTSNNLSQVINGELGKTYFDFINTHRIDKAKQYLLSSETQKMSILTIAMEAGFNSKSAFYTAFKKEAGMTPVQYKKLHKLN